MKKLWQNCSGMVTVMVTLLLIPSLLVTGTAVDIARIYTAKSILQDANQLAANSILTSYDALLQDLYGLYGIMQRDPELAGMIDRYIKLSIEGQDGRNTALGSFQLFYGSDITAGSMTPAQDQNLGNTEVLRRQIEEYAKFRVPVVLVDELLDKLDSFEKVQKDAAVIEEKMDLDDRLEDIEKVYKKIYDDIQTLHTRQDDLKNDFRDINSAIEKINEQFKEMYDVRRQYTNYVNDRPEEGTAEEVAHWKEVMKDHETRYSGLMSNIKALSGGGTVKSWWVQGTWEDEDAWEWNAGYFRDSERVSVSLEKAIENAKDDLGEIESALEKLEDDCKTADEKKQELEEKLESFEKTLNTPDACSEELQKAYTEKQPENGNKSALDIYREALKYDLEPMAAAVRGDSAPIIEQTRQMLDDLGYGDWKYDGPVMTTEQLKQLKTTQGFEISLLLDNQDGANKHDWLEDFGLLGYSLCRYNLPGPLKEFDDSSFNSTHNTEFYAYLQELFGNPESDVKKKKAKKAVTKIFAEAQEIFKGCLVYEPEGAWIYTPYDGGTGAEAPEESFGQDGDWSKEGEGKDQAKKALKGDLVQRLGSLADGVGNHLLLLGYDSEMFSCYTTNKGSEQGRTSMAGVPLGIDVNYFYQSELEYLYAGSYNAQDNLKAVAGMIFLVRFVFNYIASFQIEEVNKLVREVKDALSGIAGPFAFIIGELVRVGMALGESALDVGRIREGHTVKLFKRDDDNNSWRFSMSGLIDALSSGDTENVTYTEKNTSNLDDEGADAFSYRDYLRVFLLLKSDTDLAQRTQKLIELNLTNKKNGIGGKGDHTAREAAMSAVPLVDLSKAATGFTLTTTAELRMLFLSMPVARNSIEGVIPPGSVPISVTDYRGY